MRPGPHSQTAMCAIALGAVAMAALPTAGAALPPPLPPCAFETLDPQEAYRDWYHFYRQGADFVVYSWFDGDRHVLDFVVEHCPSRNRMTAEVDWPANRDAPASETPTRVGDAIDAAFAAPETYSLRDLARIARDAGAARARVSRVDFESCACRLRHEH